MADYRSGQEIGQRSREHLVTGECKEASKDTKVMSKDLGANPKGHPLAEVSENEASEH